DPRQMRLWDIAGQRFTALGEPLQLVPQSIQCFRVLGEGAALLDVSGQIFLDAVEESAGGATLRGYFTPQLTVHCIKPLMRAVQESAELSIEVRQHGEYNEAIITNIAP